jgi:hypothetical protein
MILLKSLVGGVVAAVVMWIAIVLITMWRLTESSKQHGATGLVAVSGGWNYLIQLPWVVLLLTGAFGAGVYLVGRAR